MANPVHIVGVGMVTPVGDSAKMTFTSVRAGISALKESSVYNKRFEPMTMALVPEDALPPLRDELDKTAGLTSRQRRMLRLANTALSEAMPHHVKQSRPPLFLAGPETIPECPKPIDDAFLARLHLQTGGAFDLAKSRLFADGRASGVEATLEAFKLLGNGMEELVLVGGVDSYLDLYLLGTLDRDNRVLANGIMDGFAPGEGGCFLLMTSGPAMEKHALQPIAEICQPALAEEPGHRYGEAPYKGDGLAQAVTEATAPLGGEKIKGVFLTLNGENFHAKEWGTATLRNSAALAEALSTQHPADCYGDPGAAAGPLMIGLAAMGMKSGKMKGPTLICCSSEKEKRGAVCLK